MKRILFIGALASAASSTVFSEQNPNLEHVLVSATRAESKHIPTPGSISVITQEQIAISGANTLADILEEQAGIQLRDVIGDRGRGTSISLRGFGENSTSNTLILVDGRRLNNPSLEASDLNAISLQDIERVEIIHGSAGALFGEGAVGGVINIITARPETAKTTFQVSHGTDDLIVYRANTSVGFENGLAVRASAEHKTANNFRSNNDTNYKNYNVWLGYRNDLGEIFVEAQDIDDDLRLPGSLSQSQATESRRQSNTPGDFSDNRTLNQRLGGKVKIGNNWQLLAEYSLRDADNQAFLYGSNQTKSTDVETFTPRAVGQWQTKQGNIIATIGADIHNNRYKLSGGFSARDASQDLDEYYTQVVFPVTSDLTATAGVRSGEVDESDTARGKVNKDTATATDVGASYQLGQTDRIFLRRSEAFRFANADENGLTLTGIDFLSAQESTSWEAGYELSQQNLNVNFMLYRLVIDNEITYDPFAYANINQEKNKRTGSIIDVQAEITPKLSLLANYTYTDTEITVGTKRGKEVPFISRDLANFAATYRFTDAFSVYTSINYTGKRYPAGDDSNQAAKLDSYVTVDTNLRWQKSHWIVNLRLSNITNEKYEGYSGNIPAYGLTYLYPAPEESAILTIGYTF